MMVYAETSAVLRWLFNEEAGEQILEALQQAEKVVCSRVTLVEVRRVIRRAVAESHIRETQAADLLAVFGQASGQK